ncbi:MAG: diguanylate cyclase domain-containing protein [Thainema sp.]
MKFKLPHPVRLRTVLAVPLILHVVGVVALVGYFSFRNGQQGVQNLAHQLMIQVGQRITAKLDVYLETPHRLNRLHVSAIQNGYVDVNDREALQRYFYAQLQSFDTLSTTSFENRQTSVLLEVQRQANERFYVGESGAANRFTLYELDAAGNRHDPSQTTDSSWFSYPWYADIPPAGVAAWNPVQVWRTAKYPMQLTATLPLYDEAENLHGIFSTGVSIESINQFLQTLSVSPTGQVYIVEPSGWLVASSLPEPPFLTDGEQMVRRLNALDSQEPLIRDSMNRLTEKFDSLAAIDTAQFFDLKLEREAYFSYLMPFQDEHGLDWLVVILVPKSDFMAQIYANTRRSVLLCGLALLVAIASSSIMAYWLSQPILDLNRVAKQLADGAFDSWTPLEAGTLSQNIYELNQLTQSFDQMAAQLITTVQALKRDEQRLTRFLETIPIGVAIHHADGSIHYVNQSGLSLLQQHDMQPTQQNALNNTYGIYRAGTNQLYPVEQLPSARALTGEEVATEDIEVRDQGRSIPLRVHAKPIFAATGEIEYAVVVFEDITMQRQAQQILQDYSQHLEQEVAERTQALESEIQERQLIEQELTRSRNELESITDSIQAGIAYINAERRYQFVNRYYEVRLGLSPTEILGRHIWDIVGEENYQRAKPYIDRTLAGEQTDFEFSFVYQPKGERILHATMTPDQDADGTIRGYYLFFFDITERKQMEEALRQANSELSLLASLDGLTQVANRRRFDDYLAQEWRRLMRDQQPISLIMFDIDFFKKYNDHYGHLMGDEALVEVAQTAKDCIRRPADLLARYGGEEFAVILPNTHLEGAIAVAQQIQQAIRDLGIPHADSAIAPCITLSLGVATLIPASDQKSDELIHQADMALYHAKNQGRDRVVAATNSESLH